MNYQEQAFTALAESSIEYLQLIYPNCDGEILDDLIELFEKVLHC